jgi:hypothetical protein
MVPGKLAGGRPQQKMQRSVRTVFRTSFVLTACQGLPTLIDRRPLPFSGNSAAEELRWDRYGLQYVWLLCNSTYIMACRYVCMWAA